MVWSHELLWQKAKLFASRAFDESERGSDQFSLWCALALEALTRATLAQVHPALLADPQAGANLLYAFGYGVVTQPKSITTKTVLDRCKTIVPDFTEREVVACAALFDRRNSELHSGDLGFANYPTSVWLADFFRVCDILLRFQGKKLDDLLGKEEAVAATTMIAEAAQALLGSVSKRVDVHRTAFEALAEPDKAIARASAPKSADKLGRLVECPACGSKAKLTGENIRAGEPKLWGDQMAFDMIILPTLMSCAVCGLHLDSHGELHVVGLGGQYTAVVEESPEEFFGLMYEEPDYGND